MLGGPNDHNAILQESKRLLAESARFSDVLFEKGQAYNNAIILAGFGGLFALLTASSSLLPREVLAACAILLGISLTVYVGYVIYTMYVMGFAMLNSARSQLNSIRMMQQQTGLDASEIIKQLEKLSWNIRLWKLVWVTSVATGMGAGMLMLVFYMGALISSK